MATKKNTAAAPAAKRVAPGSAEAKAVASYNVLTSVTHGQDVYEPGDTIELSGKEAAPLIEVKAIEPIGAEEPDPT
jgi:hypothetical protein